MSKGRIFYDLIRSDALQGCGVGLNELLLYMQRRGLVVRRLHSHFLPGVQRVPIRCRGREFQGIGTRRLLHIDPGEGIPILLIAGFGEHDVVLQPGAMQRAGRLVEFNLEEYGRAAFQMLRGPACSPKAGTLLCASRRKSQKEQNECDPWIKFHFLSIEPVSLHVNDEFEGASCRLPAEVAYLSTRYDDAPQNLSLHFCRCRAGCPHLGCGDPASQGRRYPEAYFWKNR